MPRRGCPDTRTAAWRRHFPDVATPAPPGHQFDVIVTALAACRHTPWQAIPDTAPRRLWSGWPHTPGAGPTLVSLYQWATHHTDHDTTSPEHGATAREVMRPQLLDQPTVNSLIHLGWIEDPVAARFTGARYLRYCHLLHTWAAQADVAAELVEMWLSARWRERTAHHARTR